MENSNSIRLLSIGLGVLMLFHGINKVINGIDPIIGMLEGAGIPYANYIALGVFVVEIIAPLLLIAGQYVRTAGAIIAF
ncbi:MAG TPA: DoxX family protein, partial [Campylobacterales bacterium]|nr:DoxX family protein [Campylobacterales bacterium]